jgi:undecaprenyl diphosphate synthase
MSADLSEQVNLPRHIAIIMDGNGRWAKQRGLARHQGHQAGAKVVRSVVECAAEVGIEVLTLFAFSRENWKRPESEVRLLLELFVRTLKLQLRSIRAAGIRFRMIGEREAFPRKLQDIVADAEASTRDNAGMVLQVAANYSGQWDILQAANRAMQRGDGALTQQAFEQELSFAGLPDPDLYIRTGGERRLSNFILWQAAYAELYFSDVFWPDFGPERLRQALASYAERRRRFGMTDEQLAR